MGSKHQPPKWWLLGGVEESVEKVYAFLGKDIPVLDETYVVPHREPAAIGWTTQHYTGSELLDVETREIISASRDLVIGEEVLVPSLFGYYQATVTGPRMAETDGSIFYLDRDLDDRHAWTSASQINKAAIRKINIKVATEV